MRMLLTALCLLCFCMMDAGAEEGSAQVFFTLRKAGSDAPAFAVTADVLAKVGTVTYKAILPGTDETLHTVRGPLLRDLLKAAGLTGTTAAASALDSYQVDIPLSDFETFDVIAAVDIDGEPMKVRDKGPAWIVYPNADRPELRDAIYEARSIWQLKELLIK